jgi:hypothetical protein
MKIVTAVFLAGLVVINDARAQAAPAAPTAPPAKTVKTKKSVEAAPAVAATPTAKATPTSQTAPATSADDDDNARSIFSLPTETDRAAWRKLGFRLMLGAVFGQFLGLGGAPSGRVIGPIIRLGVRLDERWSLLGTFQYLYAAANKGLSGIRYSGTVEPTWHVTDHLSVAVGLGFGGIVEGDRNRTDPEPLPSTLDTSYTFPNAHNPLPSCSGTGVAALVRGDYLFVLGPRSSTGAGLEFDGQWTGCVDDTHRVEPDTATPIVRRQWWPHFGASISWMFAWR